MALMTGSHVKALLLAAPFVFVASIASAGGSIPTTVTTTNNDPSLFLGMSWTFGSGGAPGTPGITLKALSTNKRDSGALTGGVTYNFDGTFGCDIGVAYNTSGATITSSYDICKRGFQMGLGATKSPTTTTTTSYMYPEENR
ncbi:hypothetical protein SAMN05877809_102589 [Rhodobacter sp. JA431]|nr:hypothetical protein SAMN05877809_102589 [Rhodobacter sp. JA431]